MSSSVDVSIIVCCYNSEALLPETMRHLAAQEIPDGFSYEVVLVDNNSSDNTAATAKQLWKEFGSASPLNVIFERTPGLSHARKAGVKEAKADLIIFCDDDNWLASNYSVKAHSIMKKHPKIGALGGLSKGVLEGDTPDWWHEQAMNYAVGIQAPEDGDISERGFVWGAGLVIRKTILTQLFKAKFHSLLLGRTGAAITSGDDSEICKWVLIMGYRLWYSEALKFSHYITERRLKHSYMVKLNQGHQASLPILELYDWFLKNSDRYGRYSQQRERATTAVRVLIRGILGKDPNWRRKLQLMVGPKVKVHPILFHIDKTYRNLLEANAILT
ncbi:glycosyltransferase family 2 protein [Flavobacteriaceae bacterium TK19130]|nr:glycosyltransferase family 2 protein [Thermobacterium salinum]